ncbi:hypothetical protein [Rhabdothermincola salaria]|uniref:hypothetical protein n=1 Tax=Rhabdothermincola salaria TaxID=2903142 RepID=UPI001E606F6B|nr:hypothetical protein [Rhabdothermincola salaria]MCD9623680.1 hypothetical protein [Rhabdothermincola salaria]
MAAPDYVPTPTDDKARVYASPPRRPDSWRADRPAELGGRQPQGPRLGNPGPDQGYAMKLANQFRGKLVLTAGEHEDDALSGCLALAMRRAALFGRAPMIHDITFALNLWGFLTEPTSELAAARRDAFAGVASSHHYTERGALVASVPDDVLRLTPAEVATMVAAEPARVLALAEAALAAHGADTSTH